MGNSFSQNRKTRGVMYRAYTCKYIFNWELKEISPWKWLRWGSLIAYAVKVEKANAKHFFRILTLKKSSSGGTFVFLLCLWDVIVLPDLLLWCESVYVCVCLELGSAISKVHIGCTFVSQSNKLGFWALFYLIVPVIRGILPSWLLLCYLLQWRPLLS